MAKKKRVRQTVDEILVSCSESLFPSAMGKAPVELNCSGAEGDTPLHLVLWRGDEHAALKLIEAGANVNALGDMSETPLHIAVRKQDITVIEAMLEAGADVSCMSEFGQSPKSLADEIGGEVRKLFSRR